MMKRLILALVCALVPSFAGAQSYTSINVTNLRVDDGSGTSINPPSGTNVCFTGVNFQGVAITYTPSGGSPVSGPVCGTLNGSGTLTASMQVANPALATPQGLRYTITVTNGSTTYLTYPITQISGPSFALATYPIAANGSLVGLGYPHQACVAGANYASTTLPAGQDSSTCQIVSGVGTWIKYPQSAYCPVGTAYVVPQQNGTPFCVSPLVAANGAPTGACYKNSLYFRQDMPGTIYGCFAAAWVQISGSGGGGGLTSFNGRTTPAATLQSSDLTSLFSNAPFGLSGSNGILTDSGGGAFTPASNWKIQPGSMYGWDDFNIYNASGGTGMVHIDHTTGGGYLAQGNFNVSGAGALSFGGGPSISSSSLLCQSSGLNCPAAANPFYQSIQNDTSAVLQQQPKVSYHSATGISAANNTGNTSTDVALANIPNSSLANSGVTILTTGALTGGGTVALGGTITLNGTGGGGGSSPVGQNEGQSSNSTTTALAHTGTYYDSDTPTYAQTRLPIYQNTVDTNTASLGGQTGVNCGLVLIKVPCNNDSNIVDGYGISIGNSGQVNSDGWDGFYFLNLASVNSAAGMGSILNLNHEQPSNGDFSILNFQGKYDGGKSALSDEGGDGIRIGLNQEDGGDVPTGTTDTVGTGVTTVHLVTPGPNRWGQEHLLVDYTQGPFVGCNAIGSSLGVFEVDNCTLPLNKALGDVTTGFTLPGKPTFAGYSGTIGIINFSGTSGTGFSVGDPITLWCPAYSDDSTITAVGSLTSGAQTITANFHRTIPSAGCKAVTSPLAHAWMDVPFTHTSGAQVGWGNQVGWGVDATHFVPFQYVQGTQISLAGSSVNTGTSSGMSLRRISNVVYACNFGQQPVGQYVVVTDPSGNGMGHAAFLPTYQWGDPCQLNYNYYYFSYSSVGADAGTVGNIAWGGDIGGTASSGYFTLYYAAPITQIQPKYYTGPGGLQQLSLYPDTLNIAQSYMTIANGDVLLSPFNPAYQWKSFSAQHGSLYSSMDQSSFHAINGGWGSDVEWGGGDTYGDQTRFSGATISNNGVLAPFILNMGGYQNRGSQLATPLLGGAYFSQTGGSVFDMIPSAGAHINGVSTLFNLFTFHDSASNLVIGATGIFDMVSHTYQDWYNTGDNVSRTYYPGSWASQPNNPQWAYGIRETASYMIYPNLQTGSCTDGLALDVYHRMVRTPCSFSYGSTPTVVYDVGAGTGGGGTYQGTDAASNLALTTGTTPTASSVVATITLSAARGSGGFPICSVSPADANAAALSGAGAVWTVATGLKTFELHVGSTALTASTTYTWNLICP